jgi:hypothetical protein
MKHLMDFSRSVVKVEGGEYQKRRYMGVFDSRDQCFQQWGFLDSGMRREVTRSLNRSWMLGGTIAKEGTKGCQSFI